MVIPPQAGIHRNTVHLDWRSRPLPLLKPAQMAEEIGGCHRRHNSTPGVEPIHPGQRFVVLPVPLVLFVVSSPEELDVATEGTTSTENHRWGYALGVGFRPGRFQAPAVRAGFLW